MPTINPEKWHEVKEIFYAALRHAPEEREQFLNESCQDDGDLRREVESLLSSSEVAGSFMQNQAVDEVAETIAGKGEKLRVNQSLSHYKIISHLGAGGMGEVFLAEDTHLHRKVALKVLPKKIAADKERLHRFEQEANAASALNHPNILTVHEFGFDAGVHFLATEFVDGETLREKINEAELSLTNSLKIAEQTAFALLTAHASGIIHRDIKPENIMIRTDDIVKVLDFGLAKLIEKKVVSDGEADTRPLVKTMPGVIMGTASYMSPEQARGKEIDVRTDTFSLGVVLYEMLTGHLPFAGDTMNDAIAAILTKEPPPLARYVSDVPTELQRIVRKALTKERDGRYQTARDLMIDLKTLRRDLDLHGELERSAAPNEIREQPTQIAKDKPTDSTVAVSTNGRNEIHSTSSAEYLVSEIKHHKRGFIGILSILMLAAIGLGYWFYANRPVSIDVKQINSIAVLPFENGSNDANLDYLSDGLSESLIDRLSQLSQLKVIARSSSFKYRGENIDLQDAANKLDVQAIITGKVTQRGDNLSIRVEMVDVRDNRQLWSEQYNRRATDTLTLQQEIAHIVSEKLRLKLSGAEEQQIAKQNTVNPQAYELLLRGRFVRLKGGGRETLNKAIEYFEQATAVDPNYALAFAELSFTYSLIGSPSKAETAANKALELDENLADAHVSLGVIKSDEWDWESAEREFLRAIELNPNLARAHMLYSDYLSTMNLHEQAIAEAKRGKELDPLSPRVNINYGFAFVAARQYEQAIEIFNKTPELNPNFPPTRNALIEAYFGKGMYAEAVAELQEISRLEGDNSYIQTYLSAIYARSGKRDQAQAILKQLEMSKEDVSPFGLAALYANLGERDKAFASLEKAYAAHDSQLRTLKYEALFDPLRDDPRFHDLLRRVGLPQ